MTNHATYRLLVSILLLLRVFVKNLGSSHNLILVDDIVRTKRVPSSDCARITLSTTIQTGYEWHENLEAVIDLSTSNLKLEVKANNKKIR